MLYYLQPNEDEKLHQLLRKLYNYIAVTKCYLQYIKIFFNFVLIVLNL